MSPSVSTPDSNRGYPAKRARTQAGLRRAGMQALGTTGPAAVTVGQVAKLAGTSSATFYNHFGSVADLLSDITEELGAGVAIKGEAFARSAHDPAVRVAIGTLQLLELADQDPVASAAFVTLAGALPEFRTRIRSIVGRAIAAGVDQGRFAVSTGAAPVNAVLGTTLQSMRSRVLGEATTGDRDEVVRSVLRVLGLSEAEADEASRQAGCLLAAAQGAESGEIVEPAEGRRSAS